MMGLLAKIYGKYAHEQNIRYFGIAANYVAKELEQPIEKNDSKGVGFRYRGENQVLEPPKLAQLDVSRYSGDEVHLRIGVRREGTDRLISYYLSEAGTTQDEIKAWLKNTDACVPIIASYARDLSDRVDDYWD